MILNNIMQKLKSLDLDIILFTYFGLCNLSGMFFLSQAVVFSVLSVLTFIFKFLQYLSPISFGDVDIAMHPLNALFWVIVFGVLLPAAYFFINGGPPTPNIQANADPENTAEVVVAVIGGLILAIFMIAIYYILLYALVIGFIALLLFHAIINIYFYSSNPVRFLLTTTLLSLIVEIKIHDDGPRLFFTNAAKTANFFGFENLARRYTLQSHQCMR